MARAHRLTTSRKEHTCGRGGHPIPVGDGYYWAAPGYRARKQYRCLEHPFKPSELTTSLVSEALAAQEAFEAALEVIDPTDTDALDQITSEVEQFASSIREYADQRRESADDWENGNSQLEEYADTAEAAADEAENYQVDDWDGDEEARDYDGDEPGDDDTPDLHEKWTEHVDALLAWEEHVTEQIEAARDMAASLEF